jgi:NAD(P)-dependent dehydrogenase (short-subunit alcohol dehydrogenase family)
MGRFDNRVVVVTGAAGGIGVAACERFASEGARIVAVDMVGADLSAVVGAAEAAGAEAIAVEADVTVEEQVIAYVARAEEQFGRVDVLFNNAGIEGPVAGSLDYEAADFDRVMAVNVNGVFYGLKHAVAAMLRGGGGAIVNTASVAGLAGTPGVVAYGASKHAVVGLTRTFAREFAGRNIRTNAICPSPINTRMWDALVDGMGGDDPDAFRKSREVANPMGRYGEPAEVAAVVAFLASDDASYLTGAILPVDGGARAQ